MQHSALLQRQLLFTALAIIEILSVLASSVVSVVMAMRGHGYWALVAWSLTVPLASALAMWFYTGWIRSWLNLVELWFALLTNKQIKRAAHRSTRTFETAILAYIALSNTAPKPFVWTKTADEILASVARFCHRISGTGH